MRNLIICSLIALLVLAVAPSVADAATLKKGAIACVTEKLFDQITSLISQNDRRGAEYLLGKGCIIVNADYEASILKRGFTTTLVRAYLADGSAVELWTYTEAVVK